MGMDEDDKPEMENNSNNYGELLAESSIRFIFYDEIKKLEDFRTQWVEKISLVIFKGFDCHSRDYVNNKRQWQEGEEGWTELVLKPTPPPRVATMQTYEKSQKGQEVVESKPTSTMLNKVKTTEKSQKGEEEFQAKLEPTMMTKVKIVERAQKGEEEFEAKPTSTMLTKVSTTERPQKGELEFEAKPTPTILTKVKTSERPRKDEEEFEAKLSSLICH
ncbi:hypothetical protein JHK85_010071 [Glycine max]|nr:hypothetical protein JHK85_010071 [Glycine max]